MSRVDQIVWKSAIDERELLRLERQSGAICIAPCNITLTQLRELQKAAEECVEIATLPVVAQQPEGGSN